MALGERVLLVELDAARQGSATPLAATGAGTVV